MSNTYQNNLKRLIQIAQDHSLALNPDEERIQKVVGLMANNYDAVEEWVCPCKQTMKPVAKGIDKSCPCPEWLEEVEAEGHCFCKLFYTEEKAALQ